MTDLDKDIIDTKRKLRELERIKKNLERVPLALSAVYKDGLVYGLAYLDGHGTIEMLEVVNNWPERLVDIAKEYQKGVMKGSSLYIMGLRPEKVIQKIGH